MIHPERFVFKKKDRKDYKHCQGDHFLDHFQLDQGKWSAVALKADAVCGHLQCVFKQSDSPTDKNDSKEAKLLKAFHFPKFQMTVPGQCHKHI